MRLSRLLCTLLMLAAFSSGNDLSAQQRDTITMPSAKDTGTKLIRVVYADVYGYLKRDSLNEIQKLVGKVHLIQDGTHFYCDSAVRNMRENVIEAFGHVHINDKDSVHTYSDYLKYYGNERKAILRKRVRLTDGKGTLTTEELEYDMLANIGTYQKGGKVVNGETVLTSQEGFYYADTREVYFKKNVVLTDPDYNLSTDTLLYNIDSEVATFVAPTTIYDGKSTIRTSSGYYDLKNGVAFFGNRPEIVDSTQYVTADKIDFDKSTGIGIAEGNFLYKDTTQGVTVLSGKGIFNRDARTFEASVKPLMILKQEEDSIYVTADTLYSGMLAVRPAGTDTARGIDGQSIADTLQSAVRVIDVDSLATESKNGPDTVRFFRAHYHVRIFSDSLQAVADSLYYSGVDSVFRLYREPLLWSGDSQVSGDTMYLYTRNKKPDRVEVFLNGFAINKTGQDAFNQIKGNTLHAFFVAGNIERMRARGSAESVYYILDDDSAFVGVKHAVADMITLYFEQKDLTKVTWVNGVDGTLYPVRVIPEEKKRLRGFRWQEARRPKTKYELFE